MARIRRGSDQAFRPLERDQSPALIWTTDGAGGPARDPESGLFIEGLRHTNVVRRSSASERLAFGDCGPCLWAARPLHRGAALKLSRLQLLLGRGRCTP